MATEKKDIYWVRIEAEYRAGIKPLRLLAEEHGITHGAINKRAKRDGWVRDLTPKIRAAADAKVSKAVVSDLVSAEKVATEREVIDANSDAQVFIRLGHRTKITRSTALWESLMSEQEVYGTETAKLLLAELIDIANPLKDGEDEEAAAERIARAKARLRKAMEFSGRVMSAKQLIDMLEKLVKMEREAWGIDGEERGESSTEMLLKKIRDAQAGT